MTIIYLFRVFNTVFLGEPMQTPAAEGSPVMVSCVASLAGLSIMAGVFIYVPSTMAEMAVGQMLGVIR